MELPCKGEATGFANEKERDIFGLYLLAQIRYHEVMYTDPQFIFDNQQFERTKQLVEELSALIRKEGANEAILDERR